MSPHEYLDILSVAQIYNIFMFREKHLSGIPYNFSYPRISSQLEVLNRHAERVLDRPVLSKDEGLGLTVRF